jgi:hypothetical protein
MIDHIAGSTEPLDHDTSQSICSAIGERLQRDLSPKCFALLPPRLERLLDELRRQDANPRF